jgi:hypothetical protein
METAVSVQQSIQPGKYLVSRDCQNDYRHLSINPAFRKFLRFSLDGTLFQFLSMVFGRNLVPHATL